MALLAHDVGILIGASVQIAFSRGRVIAAKITACLTG